MHQEIDRIRAKLSDTAKDENDLKMLQDWCEAHISQDIRFIGSWQEKYQQYWSLLNDFADNYTSLDIFTLARLGYDRVIASNGYSRTEINQATANGMTALHFAALYGHTSTCGILLINGADPTIESKRKQLPVHSALLLTMYASNDKELMHKKSLIVSSLINAVPETGFAVDILGNTIFHYMAIFGFDVLLKEFVSCVNECMFKPNKQGRYPVHEAILNNKPECLEVLLNIENRSNLEDSVGRLPIHYAAIYGFKDLVEICCKKTSDLNVIDGDGKPPIVLAIESDNLSAFKTLLTNGASPEFTNRQRHTILHIAVIYSKSNIVDWILSHNLVNVDAVDMYGKVALDYCDNPQISAIFSHRLHSDKSNNKG